MLPLPPLPRPPSGYKAVGLDNVGMFISGLPLRYGERALGRSKHYLLSENNLILCPQRPLGMMGPGLWVEVVGLSPPDLLGQLLLVIVFSNKDYLCVFF